MQVAVLGLGPSFQDFKGAESLTIGVNDIWKKHPADIVICLDLPDRFTEGSRLDPILKCKPDRFISHLEEWSGVNNFEKMDLISPRGSLDFSNVSELSYAIFTPFTAMDLAVKLGATSIKAYGLDFVSHWNFQQPEKLQQCIDLLVHFKNECPVPFTLSESSEILPLLPSVFFENK